MSVPLWAPVMWNPSHDEDSSGSLPSLPKGLGNGLIWMFLQHSANGMGTLHVDVESPSFSSTYFFSQVRKRKGLHANLFHTLESEE